MIHPTVERRWFGEFDHRAVDDRADKALLPRRLEDFPELSLAPAHERREHFNARAGGPVENGIGDLAGALPLDGAPAVRTVRRASSRVEQSQVVVDLGHRSDGGARIVPRRFLLDRNRRRKALDGVHIGLFHQAEELSRVGGERLDVPSLPLGENGVERE